MIELYLSKVTETSESEQAGKLYARVDYKESLNVQDMAHHMAEHNTAFSEGLITGILIDFVKCVREQVLNGNTVKIDNLAIFKATVEANALETMYDAQNDKVALATIGNLAEGAKTGAAVVAEEHNAFGGLSEAVASVVVAGTPAPVEFINGGDKFGQSGTPAELMAAYGLDAAHIVEAAKKAIARK